MTWETQYIEVQLKQHLSLLLTRLMSNGMSAVIQFMSGLLIMALPLLSLDGFFSTSPMTFRQIRQESDVLQTVSGTTEAHIPMDNVWSFISDFLLPSAYAEQLSPHFKREEFNQKQKPLPLNKVKVDPELIRKLELLRALIKKPIIINSGYRSPSYNAMVGGVPNSRHQFGEAADIRVKGMSPLEVANYARQVGFGYIEPTRFTPTWTHVDTRKKK